MENNIPIKVVYGSSFPAWQFSCWGIMHLWKYPVPAFLPFHLL
jgi:hypothetical protein